MTSFYGCQKCVSLKSLFTNYLQVSLNENQRLKQSTLDRIGEVEWAQGNREPAVSWCRQGKAMYEVIDMVKCMGYKNMMQRLDDWGTQL